MVGGYGILQDHGLVVQFNNRVRHCEIPMHRFGQRTDIFDRGFEHFGQFPGRDERPVAPYERPAALSSRFTTATDALAVVNTVLSSSRTLPDTTAKLIITIITHSHTT